MRALRATGGLSQTRAVDAERARSGAAPVRGRGIPPDPLGAPPQLREIARRRNLGARVVPASGSDFKDHFSHIATDYATHRPTYPTALVALLARLAPARRLAWDAGCGSGQLSVLLADRFES